MNILMTVMFLWISRVTVIIHVHLSYITAGVGISTGPQARGPLKMDVGPLDVLAEGPTVPHHCLVTAYQVMAPRF